MKNNFSKSQTYFAIKLKIDENISYLLSYLRDGLTFKDVLRMSICGTASNSAVTKPILYSVNPQLTQISLIFWGYPKIFLFIKQVNQVQLRLVPMSLTFLFIPPHPLYTYWVLSRVHDILIACVLQYNSSGDLKWQRDYKARSGSVGMAGLVFILGKDLLSQRVGVLPSEHWHCTPCI